MMIHPRVLLSIVAVALTGCGDDEVGGMTDSSGETTATGDSVTSTEVGSEQSTEVTGSASGNSAEAASDSLSVGTETESEAGTTAGETQGDESAAGETTDSETTDSETSNGETQADESTGDETTGGETTDGETTEDASTDTSETTSADDDSESTDTGNDDSELLLERVWTVTTILEGANQHVGPWDAPATLHFGARGQVSVWTGCHLSAIRFEYAEMQLEFSNALVPGPCDTPELMAHQDGVMRVLSSDMSVLTQVDVTSLRLWSESAQAGLVLEAGP